MRLIFLFLILGCSVSAAPIAEEQDVKTLSSSDLLGSNSTDFFEEMELLEAEAKKYDEYLHRQACWIAVVVVLIISGLFCCIYYCCKYYGDFYVFVYFNSAIFRNLLLKIRVFKETRKQKAIIKQRMKVNENVSKPAGNMTIEVIH